jgi:lysophospholipase L1-like esterase
MRSIHPTRLSAGFLLLIMAIGCVQRQHGKRIIFLGDSITQEGAGPGGYIDVIEGMLGSHGLDDHWELVGAGIPGNKVGDLRRRLAADVLDDRPDIVVVYIGINDVWHKRTLGAGTETQAFKATYQGLIDTLKAHGIRPVLCTPSVIGERPDGSNPQDEDLDRYSDIVRDLARRSDLPIIDLRNAFRAHLVINNPEHKDAGILTTDGVHLNAAGNRLVAEAMWAVLNDL